jgi:hypothetical protein
MNTKLIILAVYIAAVHALTFYFLSLEMWDIKQDLSNQLVEMLGEDDCS